MQYLLDRFPPPASTGSWSRFLGIVHSWGDSALQQTQARRTLWYRWGYWLFFACLWVFFLNPFTSGLCCGTVHHLREEKQFTPGFGGNVTCKITPLSMYEGTDQESCWVSLSSAISFVVPCADSFPRPGPGVFSLSHLCGQWPVPVHPITIHNRVGSVTEPWQTLQNELIIITNFLAASTTKSSTLAYLPTHMEHLPLLRMILE